MEIRIVYYVPKQNINKLYIRKEKRNRKFLFGLSIHPKSFVFNLPMIAAILQHSLDKFCQPYKFVEFMLHGIRNHIMISSTVACKINNGNYHFIPLCFRVEVEDDVQQAEIYCLITTTGVVNIHMHQNWIFRFWFAKWIDCCGKKRQHWREHYKSTFCLD